MPQVSEFSWLMMILKFFPLFLFSVLSFHFCLCKSHAYSYFFEKHGFSLFL